MNRTDRRGKVFNDILGPDGKTCFPDFRLAGMQGGIPKVKSVVNIDEFGAKADDDRDDGEALQKACEAAGKAGGGAVLLLS